MGTGHALNARVGTANRIVTVSHSFRYTLRGTLRSLRRGGADLLVSRCAKGDYSRLLRLLGGVSGAHLCIITTSVCGNVSLNGVRSVAGVSV